MENRKSRNASYSLTVLIVTIFIAILLPCVPAFADSTWEFVSSMSVRRQMFGAALGDDGFIYAVGGFIWPEHITLSSVERYDPATDNWTFVAPLNTPRYGHAVIRSKGLIYAIGGTNGVSVFGTMETYDVATDSWTVSPYSLNIPRKHLAVTTDHSGKIYAISGAAADGSYLGSVEWFDPDDPGWHILEHGGVPIEINEPRSGLGSGTDKLKRIYAIAGDTNPFGVGETDTVERFDPSNPSAGWVYGPSLNQRRDVGAYATAVDGRIYVLGGWAGGGGPHLSSVEVYDLATDTWRVHSNMNRSINNLAAAFDPSDKLYAIGGEHFDTQNQVERTQIYPPPIPIQLQWSTFHGGSNKDIGDGIAVDEDGNVYITGYTKSTDFATPGAYDVSLGGEIDAYVSKFTADGTLLWSTYLGGTNYEEGRGIAVDGSGNVYVTGMTESADFPTQSGYDEDYNGGSDVFVSKFGADGTLLWSTFLGGSGYDRGYDISCDASGNVYIVGYTNSTNFPTPNGYDTSHNGNYDAFVSEFSEDGSLLWSTYLGGANLEKGYALDVDRTGNVYVAGETYSTDFPALGGYDSSYNGNGDAFVSKFSPSGSLLLSTYLGGSSGDVGSGMALDEGGNTYVTGWTQSSDFPTPNGHDTSYNGGDDAFVSRFSTSGHLLWSTYLGGSNLDRAYELAMPDRPRGIYVIGRTQSGDFPTIRAYDPSHNASDDVFISMYGPQGALLWSTYLGGSNWDEGAAIATDGSGDIYATGFTYSSDFPTPGGYDTSLDGDCDAFLIKFRITAPHVRAKIAIVAARFLEEPISSWTVAPIEITLKNEGSEYSIPQNVWLYVDAIDVLDKGIGDSFWLDTVGRFLGWEAQIRETRPISFSEGAGFPSRRYYPLPEIAPGSTEVITGYVIFSIADFTDRLRIRLGAQGGLQHDGPSELIWENLYDCDAYPPDSCNFNLQFNTGLAVWNCIGTVLTGLTSGLVGSDELEFIIQFANINMALWDTVLVGPIQAKSFWEAGDYYEAGKTVGGMIISVAKLIVKKPIGIILGLIKSGFNEIAGRGCSGLIAHAKLAIQDFVDGLIESFNLDPFWEETSKRIIGITIGCPVDFEIIPSDPNTALQTFYAGEVICIVAEEGTDYLLNLSGVEEGMFNLRIQIPLREEDLGKVYYTAVPINVGQNASLEIISGYLPGNLQMDLDGDGEPDMEVKPTSVWVNGNFLPFAHAGPDQTVECCSPDGCDVVLDGSQSYDPDGDPLTYNWYEGEILIAQGTTPTVLLNLGVHEITLIVNDGQIDSEPDTVIISIVDTTPPEISLSVSPNVLWPPNHKMVEITPTWTVNDMCDPAPVVALKQITMNEGDETNTFDPSWDDTTGDGHTTNDILVDESGRIFLRAERAGTGSGRVYTVTYTATDSSGNLAESSATVTVPHNQ